MDLLGFQKNRNIEEVRILSDAINSFNGAASRFERHYQHLEQRVRELNIELENKNIVLERNLREKQEVRNHLHNILESVATGVVVIDLKGNITTFNRAAENITGFVSRKVLGNKFDKIFNLNFFQNLQLDFGTLRAIQDNTEYGIYLITNNVIGNPQHDVNATYNWWGTTNTSLIDQMIRDIMDDF